MNLDDRIAIAEQRLIARETAVLLQAQQLKTRTLRYARSGRWLLAAGGAGVATLAGWLSKRSIGKSTAYRPRGRTTMAATKQQLPWVGLVGFAWPMVPERWRDKISPATATTLLTLGLPLVQRLIARNTPPTDVDTVADVDGDRLMGPWYLIAGLPEPDLPDDCADPRIDLLPRDEGTLDIRRECIDPRGTIVAKRGIARIVTSPTASWLRMSYYPRWLRWLPWAWSETGLLYVDEDHTEMLIGNGARDRLWLLSRTPSLSRDRLGRLVAIAMRQGYDIDAIDAR